MKTDFVRHINSMPVPAALMVYLDADYSVIPLRGKVPRVAWEKFQHRTPTMAEGREWLRQWPELDSIGFVTGAINDLVVLDSDNEDAEEWLKTNAPPTGMVSITRKGFHRFYRPGDITVPTTKGLGPVAGIDARGEGGYVVAPPSIVAGHTYQWAWSEYPLPIPTLDALGQNFFALASGGGNRDQGRRNRPQRACIRP